MAYQRARVRFSKLRVAGLLGLLVAVMLGAAALLEHYLEGRDTARLTATETFAQVGESRIRYRLRGTDMSGPTVVLLHGILASSEQWESLQDELSHKHPVLAYDRGGAGFSEGSSAHGGVQQAEELARLLDALKINRPIVVVGYSISALEARLFADRFPERTAGVVLFEPYLAEASLLPGAGHNIRRAYARIFTTGCLSTLIGAKRLMVSLQATPPQTPLEQRVSALLLSFHFWWAGAQEAWLGPNTVLEVVKSPRPLPPLIYLANPIDASDPIGPLARAVIARSSRGELRIFPHEADHSSLLTNPETRAALATAIDDLSADNR